MLVFEDSALRTARIAPHKAFCSSFKPQYYWDVSSECGNSYCWIHNTLNKHHTLLKTSVLSTPHQISTMQLSAPCLLNFFWRKGKLFTPSQSNLFLSLFPCKSQTNWISSSDWKPHTLPVRKPAGFFSPVLFTNSKTELLSDSRISHLFFPYSQFSTVLMMATLGKTCTCFPRRKYISSSLGSLFLF